jgi:hypothetical protein
MIFFDYTYYAAVWNKEPHGAGTWTFVVSATRQHVLTGNILACQGQLRKLYKGLHLSIRVMP